MKLIYIVFHLCPGIHQLRYSSIQVEYHPENINTDSQWVYYPNPELPYHRILVRHNFCKGSSGYWTETNCERVLHNEYNSCFSYINKYAYPLNTIDKPIIMKNILEWCKSRGVIGIGRWGEHQHYNSDVTVDLSMALVDELIQNL